ncbi:alkaline serine protease Alp1 [Xylariomycetidae sp. FL2044]|nr:alkaline serine protease Alp1 [Xylariomycetidae sp. FL2044]
MVGFRKLAVLLTALIPTITTALPTPEAGDLKAGKYIVTLKRGLSSDDVSDHMAYTRDVHRRNLARRGKPLKAWGSEGIHSTIHIRDHNSYSGLFDRDTLLQIKGHAAVSSVEPVKKVHAWETTTQPLAPWGLGSLSNKLAADQYPIEQYSFDTAGMAEDVYVYVIDTGIRTTHVDFGGRATFGASFVNETDTDLHGHGTHVAGTIAGATFGVAKKAQLIAVKVLDRDGGGDSDNFLRALNWVYADAKAHDRLGKSIVNLSLGLAENSDAITDATNAIFEEGVVVVAAAGNDDADATDYSPGNAVNALTVGAVAVNGTRASYSNWGPVLDVFAPGDMVNSLGIESDTDVQVLSGTSMASPHVAGLCAYLKSMYQLDSPADVVAKVKELGVQGVVGDTKGSVNLMAYNGATRA